MSRTTKAVQSLRDLMEAPTEPDDEQPGAAAGRASTGEPKRVAPNSAAGAPSPAPAFFIDEVPDVEAEPVAPASPDADLGRLRGLLDRAGDPVLPPDVAVMAGAERPVLGAGARWRNDPHPLGRIAAVLVVLVLAVACIAVGIRVIG